VNEINVIIPNRSILCACDIQDARDPIARGLPVKSRNLMAM
jgi:hypothetical protein